MTTDAPLLPHLAVFATELVRQQLSGKATNSLIDIAINAVVAGAESSSLYRLAELDRSTDDAESVRLFEAAAKELQLPVINDGVSLHEVGIVALELIAGGELDPAEGIDMLRRARSQLALVDDIRVFERIIDLAAADESGLEERPHLARRAQEEAKRMLTEREFVWCALSVWDGPAAVTDAFVQSSGFAGRDEFHSWRGSVRAAIQNRQNISAADWKKSVELTRVAVRDDVNGAGWEWPIVTSYTIAESETMLTTLESRTDSPAGGGR